MLYSAALLSAGLYASGPSATATLRNAEGKEVGALRITEGPGSVRVRVQVHDLPPGAYGLHVHSGSTCGPAPFDSAGPHFDPTHAGKHGGRLGNGHAGDLGNIEVTSNGKGKLDFMTRRLSLGTDTLSVRGRSLVLHAQLDNLSDIPPNGGSGARMACGAISVRD